MALRAFCGALARLCVCGCVDTPAVFLGDFVTDLKRRRGDVVRAFAAPMFGEATRGVVVRLPGPGLCCFGDGLDPNASGSKLRTSNERNKDRRGRRPSFAFALGDAVADPLLCDRRTPSSVLGPVVAVVLRLTEALMSPAYGADQPPRTDVAEPRPLLTFQKCSGQLGARLCKLIRPVFSSRRTVKVADQKIERKANFGRTNKICLQ